MYKPSIAFWVMAAAFLLWNLFGIYLYLVEVTLSDAQYADAFGDAKAAVRDLYPTWAMTAFAVAV